MENLTTEKKPRQFTAREIVLAWVMLAIGYGFWRISPLKYYSFGVLLWTLGMLAVTIVYLYSTGRRLSVRQWAFPAFAVVLSLTYLVTDNSAIHAWSYCLTAISYLVWLLRVYGNGLHAKNGELFLPEAIKAAVVVPFLRFGTLFPALFRPRPSISQRGSIGKIILWIVLGLCAAIVPVVAVILLLGYDENFSRVFSRIREIQIGAEVLERVFCLLAAVPVAMFLYGAFVGNQERVGSVSMSEEKCSAFMTRIRFLPRVLTAAFITPLLAVYAVFFFSQIPYYTSAISGILPAGMSYATYARDGFFQLCAVCGINAVIILACMTFCKRKEGFDVIRAVFVTLLALSSILLAVTALSKMLLYIGSYGLTPKRLYTSWFMLLLICCFVAVIVRGFVSRMNLNRTIVCTVAVFFLALALANPNAQIAKFNVTRYLNGDQETIDVEAMQDLHDAAVPQMYRLWKSAEDPTVKSYANWYLDERSRTVLAQSDPVLSFSIPSMRANETIERWKQESQSNK